ncbi:HECT-domain protein [Ostertagia ostertagi]
MHSIFCCSPNYFRHLLLAEINRILDEEELYERAVPFPVEELVHIARFCNYFCFRAVWSGLVGEVFLWSLERDVKSSVLMGEFEKKTSRGVLLMRKLSHLISLKERMLLFRKFVSADKGLDEAGIDQDGVFKEFLELTIKQVFDPALNLFHMLGGRRLCAFDELSQLDPELYRNLTFVKKYDGDVSDLSLTFSIDEDFMGKINTVDLVPGGRTIQVTNENKIDYVHRMAHHRVFSQTKQQCRAFVSGAQSVLNPAWLFLFAPYELQFIISGYSSDIDLVDLKKHVQYYGGFHGSHRLIKWLWEIVEKDFTADERRLFLKVK